MNNKLSALRQHLQQHNLCAMIIPSNDAHFSEYVADHFKCREWLTGFTGSAGTAVVTQKHAALYTDSRYFLQAEQQLKDSGFELKKEGLPETESIVDYIKKSVVNNGVVGIDGWLFSISAFDTLKQELKPFAIKCVDDPFAEIWTDRPPLPDAPAFLLDEQFAGQGVNSKLQDFRDELQPNIRESTYVVSALDEVAWLLNLRGSDVAYTPVALAFAVIHSYDSEVANCVSVCIDRSKLSQKDINKLESKKVFVYDYCWFKDKLAAVTSRSRPVIVNPNKTSISAYNIVAQGKNKTVLEENPFGVIASLKALKNETEIEGIRHAMVDDGVAWVRFWKWLEENVDSGEVTEISAAEQLRQLRAQCPDFAGESFAPIVGYKEHGAVVHYSATPESSIPLGRETFILIDTGAQYPYGTTDITRTLHLGEPTAEEKTDYTLVLKGHLQLSMAKFPHGTRGAQLDMLARQPLMQHGMTYLHGTGHGVGHFLSVHEGPQSIRLNENPALLEESMVTSCEPGVYKANRYGIRIENLLLVVRDVENEFGKFLRFEPLTLCPIDTKAVDCSLLHPCDIEYLNAYQSSVYEALSPHLNDEEKEFLRGKTEVVA